MPPRDSNPLFSWSFVSPSFRERNLWMQRVERVETAAGLFGGKNLERAFGPALGGRLGSPVRPRELPTTRSSNRTFLSDAGSNAGSQMAPVRPSTWLGLVTVTTYFIARRDFFFFFSFPLLLLLSLLSGSAPRELALSIRNCARRSCGSPAGLTANSTWKRDEDRRKDFEFFLWNANAVLCFLFPPEGKNDNLATVRFSDNENN